jgi:hypothetical protein
VENTEAVIMTTVEETMGVTMTTATTIIAEEITAVTMTTAITDKLKPENLFRQSNTNAVTIFKLAALN